MSNPAQRDEVELRNLYHKLRTPLNGIFGLAGILLDSPLRADQAEMVAMIQSSAEELLFHLGSNPEVKPACPSPTPIALHLLLAEDDDANQMVDQTLLSRLGHVVESVGDGALALARLAAGRFDALIVDCQMPVMDGFETTRRIRAGGVAGLNPHLPIIALTAYTGRAERDRCLAAGMNDCLSKPLNPAQMSAALRRCGLEGDAAARASSAAAADAAAVLDLGLMKTMRETPGHQGGTLLHDFVALFLRDEPRRIGELRALGAQRSAADLARMAHTVAGSCAMMGAKQMQRAALEVEQAASIKDWAAVDASLGGIDQAWAALRGALQAEGFLSP